MVTIDTTPAWDGSYYIEPFGFGPPGVSVTAFGQFVTAPVTGVFQSITFYLNYVGGSNLPGTTAGPLTYTEYVYAWDPAAEHAIGSALYTSSLQTLANTGGAFVPITFTPNVAVTAGNDYVAFLFANSGNYAEWGMLFSGDGGTPAGLVWDPVGTNFSLLTSSNWVFVNWQSAFTAEFSSVQPDHWTNTLGGNWSTATNWENGVPTATLNANIDASGSYSVAITKSAIAYGLLLNDANATVTDNSGPLTLAGSGGAANPNGALTIDAGTFVLNGGGLDAGTIFIGNGGTLQITKGIYTNSNALSETITDNGSIIDKTTVTITGAVSGTGSFTIANKAVLEFGAGDTAPITFASGSSGTVKFDKSLTQPTGTISGLTAKDFIDLADLPFNKGQMTVVPSLTATGDTTLTVTNKSTGQSVSLNLVGNYLHSSWTLSKDSSGTGTLVVDPPAPTSTNNSPPGLDHVVALFTHSIAGFSDQSQHGALNTNPLSQIVTNQEQFLANPHHG